MSFKYSGYGAQMKMAYIESSGTQISSRSIINALDQDFMQRLKASHLESEKFKTAKEAYDRAVEVSTQWTGYDAHIRIYPDIVREVEPQTFF